MVAKECADGNSQCEFPGLASFALSERLTPQRCPAVYLVQYGCRGFGAVVAPFAVAQQHCTYAVGLEIVVVGTFVHADEELAT